MSGRWRWGAFSMEKQQMVTRVLRSIGILLAAIVFASGTSMAYDPENTLFMDLKDGRVVIEMKPELAPNHVARSEEHTSELQSLMRTSYAVFCLTTQTSKSTN